MKVKPNRRRFLIRKKREHGQRLQKLKAKYFSAKSSGEKEKVLSQINVRLPFSTAEEYLGIKK
jgi:hypothetical protein